MTVSVWKSLLSLRSRGGRGAQLQIFSFHRVLDAPCALSDGEPTVQEFADQVAWIRDTCNVLRLSEAVRLLREDKLPPAAAAITFDDGYRNNLTNALPVLQRLQVPATVFVAVRACEQGIMWNDLIIEGLRRCAAEFDVSMGGELCRFGPETQPSTVLDRLKYVDHDERMAVAQAFYEAATDEPQPRLMMTADEVAAIAADWIEIGAHTMSHPILKNLSDERAKEEIFASKEQLEAWTGREVTLFAYPNGRRDVDFCNRDMDLVEAAGFSAAVSTDWGSARRSSARFALPRYTPWETSAFGYKSRILKTSLAS